MIFFVVVDIFNIFIVLLEPVRCVFFFVCRLVILNLYILALAMIVERDVNVVVLFC